jgi:hypothetical protein
VGETSLAFKPSRGEGPIGTGVHVLRLTGGPTATARVWVTLFFLPVLPLGVWTVKRGAAGDASWLVGQMARPGLLATLAWWAVGLLWAGLCVAPAFCAVAFFMGAKVLELGGMFSTAGLIIASLGWLDQTRERVPVRVAMRVLRGAPSVRLEE